MHVVLPLALLIGLSGCKKDDSSVLSTTTSETVAATVTQDEGYAYTASGGESVSVVTEATHARVSQVTVDASGIATYSYVPISGYSGLDSVVIQLGNLPPHKGCHKPDSSGCHRPDSLMPPPDSTHHHPKKPHRRGKKGCNSQSGSSEMSLKKVTIRFNVVAAVTGE